ncbi:hypothetical protein J2TS6_48240 [Paenibacillus albilobatus]|uniref:Uncharacterized protein n=1 Tax=Paenibacillus albilobatus TaxID=2716884 RepID=A0A919XLM2_9BACL|nr:hypothetical protein J2TS6_48240 [Paenibacillus albilobatus]
MACKSAGKYDPDTNDDMTTCKCLVCGTDVPDYEPEYCCDGRECGCMGLPIEPPLCSSECAIKVFGLKVKEDETK